MIRSEPSLQRLSRCRSSGPPRTSCDLNLNFQSAWCRLCGSLVFYQLQSRPSTPLANFLPSSPRDRRRLERPNSKRSSDFDPPYRAADSNSKRFQTDVQGGRSDNPDAPRPQRQTACERAPEADRAIARTNVRRPANPRPAGLLVCPADPDPAIRLGCAGISMPPQTERIHHLVDPLDPER
jgi:hypothetical protein